MATTHATRQAAVDAAKQDQAAILYRGFVIVKTTDGYQFYGTKNPTGDLSDVTSADLSTAEIVSRQDHHTGAWVDASIVADLVRAPADSSGEEQEAEPYYAGREYRPA